MNNFKPASLRLLGLVASVLVAVTMFRFVGTNTQRPKGNSAVSNRAATRASAGKTSVKRAELNSPLVGAVKKRDADQVKSLLARGADPNARDDSALVIWKKQMAETVTEQDYATGAMKTRERGEGARPFLGPTALMIAAYEGDDVTVQLLLDAGADLNVRGVEYGAASVVATYPEVDIENQVTPFIEAMLSGKETTMRLLLKNGADVNGRDSEGLTALDWAHNMTPTSEPTPQRKKFLAVIFRVLGQVGAKGSWDSKPERSGK